MVFAGIKGGMNASFTSSRNDLTHERAILSEVNLHGQEDSEMSGLYSLVRLRFA